MGLVPLLIDVDPDEPAFATIYVDAMVAGRSRRLLLDTGAARTRLNPTDGIDRLPALASDPSYTAFGSLRSEPLVRVREVSFGSVRLDTLEVVRSTTPGDELLGVDALEGHRLHFRFSSAVLEIDAPQLDTPTNDLLRDDRGHIYVDVTWPGASARACWDTGASATVVDAGFWHRHPQLFEPIGQSAGTDAGGSEVAAPLLQMAEAVIGRRPFRPHPVVAADLTGVNRTLDLPMDLILGFPTISQADWLFDLPRRLWAITS